MMPAYGAWPEDLEAGRPGPQLVRLSDVEPERVRWLWPGYLPLGKTAMLDGDPGLGKSTLALDLAARVTTGSPMPDGAEPTKGAVLVLSAEDGLADTIRPRLDVAGADPARVVTITEITETDEGGDVTSRPVSLPADLPAIERIVAAEGVVLVVVDVLMAYLSGQVDSHRDQDVRRALHQLAALAENTGACVLALRHLSKSGGSNGVYRGMGSIGIIGAARAAFIVAADPDEEGKRVLAPTKMNIAPEPSALAYRLTADGLHGCARVAWGGAVERSAADLLRPPEHESADERSERDEAAEWLRGYLTDKGGQAPAHEVVNAARRDLSVTKRTLQRARQRAGVTTVKEGFVGGWLWRLASEGDTKMTKASGCETPSSSSPSVSPSSGRCAACGESMTLTGDGQTTHPGCADTWPASSIGGALDDQFQRATMTQQRRDNGSPTR